MPTTALECEVLRTSYPRALTEAEFDRCFAAPMRDMTNAPEGAADIWPYVDSLDPRSVGVTRIGDVSQVSRDAHSRYDHVLLATDAPNVFLVIVVDLGAGAVLGHYLLDLNIKYGLASEN